MPKINRKELFTIPNLMSYFRILLLPVIAWAILTEHYEVEMTLLILSAISDFLDGKIARRFHMVTALGKALDPIADKLTLCVLYGCLAFTNEYVAVIVIVMIVKEIYMLSMQFWMMKRSSRTSGGAKWYGKLCTAELFLALILFLAIPEMSVIFSNILMLLTVYLMLFAWIMYIRYFANVRRILKSGNEQEKKKDSKMKIIVIMLLLLLVIVLYVIAGAVIPVMKQPAVSKDYSGQFEITNSEAGNASDRIRLIEDNTDALEERLRLIDKAEHSIIMSTFDFRDDESGRDVAAALRHAAQRGVSVEILADGFSGFLQMNNKPVFCALQATDNVELKIYNPVNLLKPWNLMGRMHDKYLIIDDYGYLLGGRNTYNLFLGKYSSEYKNYDMEVFVWNQGQSEDSSLYQVKAYFEKIWKLPYCVSYPGNGRVLNTGMIQKGAQILDDRYDYTKTQYADCLLDADNEENTMPAASIRLLSNPIHRNVKEPQVWYSMMEYGRQAEQRVYLHTPYIICNEYMYQDLDGIGRNISDFRLLLNAPENGANPFGCSDFLWEKQRVLDSGSSIYEYMGEGSYHMKAMLVDDDISIIGSFNLDMRSAYLDTELMLVIQSEEINQQLNQIMADTENYCRQNITATTYELPDGLENLTMDSSTLLKYKFIHWLTKHFRYLL